MILTTKPFGLYDNSVPHTKGLPNRIVSTSSASYAFMNNFGAPTIYKYDGSTITSADLGTLSILTTLSAESMSCALDSSGIIHAFYYTRIPFIAGTKKLIHNIYSTITDTVTDIDEVVATGGVGLPASYESIDCVADGATIHLVTWRQTSAGNWALEYYTGTTGSWSAVSTITTAVTTAKFVPRVSVYKGSVMVFADNGVGNLTTANQWTCYTKNGASWTSTALVGYGQLDVSVTQDGIRHLLFYGDKRHSQIRSTAATLTTELGAIQFEAPDTTGGVIDGTLYGYGYSTQVQANNLLVFGGASGTIYQGEYKGNRWSELRSVRQVGETVSTPVLVQTSRTGYYGVGKNNDSGWFFFTYDNEPPPTAGLTHQLVLDGRGLNTTGQVTKAQISQVIPRISVAQEVKREDDLTDLSSITQSTWHHGRGERELANPYAFFESDRMLTHIEGQMTPPYYDVATEITGASTDFNGYPVDGAIYQGNLYMLVRGDAAAQNALFSWNTSTDKWDTVTSGIDTATGDPQDLEIFNEDLWIAQGDSVNARVYDFSGTAFVNGNAPGYCFKSYADCLFRADNINEIYFSTDAATDPTAATWTFLGYVDDGSGTTPRIRRFETYGNTLLVFADFGVYQIISQGSGIFQMLPLLDDAPQRSIDNGAAAAIYGGVLYYNVGTGITRFDGSTRQEVGPNRAATASSNFQSLITEKRGKITSMVATDTILYAAIDASAQTAGRSTVQCTVGTGWHEIWKGDDAIARTMWVFYTPKLTASGVLSHRNLWINWGDTVHVMRLPDGTENPLNDPNMTYWANNYFSLITGWQTGGLPALSKTLHKVISRFEGLSATLDEYNLNVYFQLDEGTDTRDSGYWTYLTTFNTDPVQEIDLVSRFKSAPYTDDYSGATGGLSYKKIRYLLQVRGDVGSSTTTQTPFVIRDFGTRFAVRPEVRWGWTTVVQAYDEMMTLGGSREEGLAEDTRHFIYYAQNLEGPHFLDDGTLEGNINWVTNPSFEVYDPNAGATQYLATNWAFIGTPTAAVSGKHKTTGRISQKLTVGAGTTSTGIEQWGIYLPAGVPATIEVDVLVETGDGVILRVVNHDTAAVLAESELAFPALSARGPIRFTTLQALVEPQAALVNLAVQIVVPREQLSQVNTTTFYIDSAYCAFVDDSVGHYIDGDQPRCQWEGTNVTPHLNRSYRRDVYAVYITGLNEAVRERKDRVTDVSLGSNITLQMREAS